MNWEETIKEIRTKDNYKSLVHEAYLGEDLNDNIIRFSKSAEFQECLKELESAIGSLAGKSMLDIGAGNGLATISFAITGLKVSALEPDPSNTIGAGAIRKCVADHGLEDNVNVVEAWGEKLPFEDASFDIVYGRQVMHHALDLDKFVDEAARVLKPGGVFITTRDHVIKDELDKEKFLERHPLHKYYGGENAFTLHEYSSAIEKAGLNIVRSLDTKDSVINFDPWNKSKVRDRIGIFRHIPGLASILMKFVKIRLNNLAGRLHTFVAIKEIEN